MRMTKTRIAAAVLAALGVVVSGQQVLGDDATAPPAVVDVPAQMAALEVAEPVKEDSYDRDRFGYAWPDLDGDCLDTRQEVLARDLTDLDLDPAGCRVLSGTFRDPYTGIGGEAIAGKLDIDHVVSLADAWRSGAHAWNDDRRFAYANDMRVLLTANDTANRCKGDKGPAEWDEPPVVGDRVCDRQRAPLDPQLRCDYAEAYVAIKVRWGLTVTAADRDVLAEMLATCP